MKIQARRNHRIKQAAQAGAAAIMLTAVALPTAFAMPAAATHVLAHPPTSGDCTACHPKPAKPKGGT